MALGIHWGLGTHPLWIRGTTVFPVPTLHGLELSPMARVPRMLGHECPRGLGSRVGDQPEDLVTEIGVLDCHPFGCGATQIERRLSTGTVLVQISSARGTVIRCLGKVVKWDQGVNGKKPKGTDWACLP